MSTPITTPYAEVIGDPISHSKSPLIHNFWLEKLRIPAEYRAAHITPSELPSYLASRRDDLAWRGCNVTMPHKQNIIPLLYRAEAPADVIGAVNTIYPAFDRLLAGTNTDAEGFLEPLRNELSRKHLFRMARILGTGGAARAIVSALAKAGFTLVVAGRNTDKAQSLIDELAPNGEHHVVPLDHFSQPTDFEFDDRDGCYDIIVNASPLGMSGQHQLQFDFSHAPPNSIVYDIVTDPIETDFLRNAKAAGFRTIDGYAMLIGQAAAAFELFFGQAPPREYDAELRKRLMA